MGSDESKPIFRLVLFVYKAEILFVKQNVRWMMLPVNTTTFDDWRTGKGEKVLQAQITNQLSMKGFSLGVQTVVGSASAGTRVGAVVGKSIGMGAQHRCQRHTRPVDARPCVVPCPIVIW